ncbi:terminase small subunit [Dysgonomonas sp. 520]|uniref:terminase small subunit n=1 Tax=Dysgonomonas sp. 520 TaxID=2302931 RepID=UPI0013D5034B|nr:terminase small subunit [Dysgonomonas sp. 520]NDW09524.1 terminase small subunit [Dysgonomonas sp. 520]
MSKNKNLTHRQEIFCQEYLIDFNATQAAIRAGYSRRSATKQGCSLLTNNRILKKIDSLKNDRCQRLSIDADYVLRQAVALHERCMQKVEPKIQKNKIVEDTNGNPVFEFDAVNALKALELIGKHINVGAFKERMEMSGDMLNAHFVLSPIENKESVKFASSEDEVE